jgi:hypothetical protein
MERVEQLDESYEIPATFSVDEHLTDRKVLRVGETRTMRVRYSPRIARWIAEREGGEVDADGSLTLEHPLADVQWGVRHVLQYGPDAEVLEGRVLVCDGPGRVRHLEASGEPNDNRASRFRLGTSSTDSMPPEGLAPSHIYGRWDGTDSLALEASLYLRRGESAITKSDDPDTGRNTPLTLRRGTEATFNSLCGRL